MCFLWKYSTTKEPRTHKMLSSINKYVTLRETTMDISLVGDYYDTICKKMEEEWEGNVLKYNGYENDYAVIHEGNKSIICMIVNSCGTKWKLRKRYSKEKMMDDVMKHYHEVYSGYDEVLNEITERAWYECDTCGNNNPHKNQLHHIPDKFQNYHFQNNIHMQDL